MNEPKNILEAFWRQVKTRSDKDCTVQKKGGKWKHQSWGEVGEKVARLASAFRAQGLKPGDKVALFSDNCPEWVIVDFACMSAGLVSVPIYPSLTPELVQYIVEHSEAKLVVARGKDRLKKLQPNPRILKTVEIDGDFDAFVATGDKSLDPWVAHANQLSLDDLATIVYTSGTTAQPKGVMLSHRNNIAQSRMLSSRSWRTPDDIILSYLPLSHIAERLNIYRQAMVGYPIYFGQGIDTVAQDLRETRPTTFVAVPRIWEKFEEAIRAKVAQAPAGKKRLFEKALQAGKRSIENPSLVNRARSKVFQVLVGRKLKKAIGLDRCGLCMSGAAPLDRSTIEFFHSFGMPIVEGYGLTECAGASHLNRLDRPEYGTVGPELPGMDFKLAQDGEILLRGDNIFMGYYKDPEATREALKDGWLCTGDIGIVDAHGNLKITDRKKNIIVTSAGKNVAPAPIEAKIKAHPAISQVVVVGDKRKHLAALITLAPGLSRTEAHKEISAHIERVNQSLSSFETIKKFTIMDKEFNVDDGEMTATMKLKRSVIQEKYRPVIDQMYS